MIAMLAGNTPCAMTSVPASTDPVELSIVMPCLDEAETLASCIRKAQRFLEENDIAGEIVVADNGSSDGSPQIAQQLGGRVVSVESKGYGNALMGGIQAARGRYVIMGDADDSYDFASLRPFLEKLRNGTDLVLGNRFRGGILPGAMPALHKYFGNPLLTALLKLFFGSPIGECQCGLRGFRKASIDRIKLDTPGMEFASEMVVKSCINRLKITEVPIVLPPDGRDRPPHMRSFRDGWRNLRFMLLLCPLWLYFIPAGFLRGVGSFLMLCLTGGSRHLGGVTLDVHTMLLGSLCVL